MGCDCVEFLQDIENKSKMCHRERNCSLRYWRGSALGSLPEGAGTAKAVTEGVSHRNFDTPPVKNQRFLTTPSKRGPRQLCCCKLQFMFLFSKNRPSGMAGFSMRSGNQPLVLFHAVQRNERQQNGDCLYILLVLGVIAVVLILADF